jgi:uncharacterized protein YidB (DUF937 family)
MSRGLPSMTALLGLLAVAGFQNRDKLGELFGQVTRSGSGNNNGAGNPLGGLLGGGSSAGGLGGLLGSLGGGNAGGLGGLLGGASVGGALSGGLGGLLDRFQENGHGKTATSWISTGTNEPIEESQLEQALGADVVEDLTQRTGLSKQELLARLSRELPKAVDELTPNGKLPSEDEFSKYN